MSSKRPKLDSLEATAVPKPVPASTVAPTVEQFEKALRHRIGENKRTKGKKVLYFTWTQPELETYGEFLKLKLNDAYRGLMAVDKNELHLACQYGFVQLATELIEDEGERQGKGAAVPRLVDTVSEENKTPLDYALDYALEYEDLSVATLLIENGADVDNQSPTGDLLRYNTSPSAAEPPLIRLCWTRHITQAILKTAQFLAKKGANLNLQKESVGYSATPLGALVYMSATNDPVADINRLLLFDYLLTEGAKMYTPMTDGETVMHLACRLGKIQFAEVLRTKGFDLTITTRDGKTPLESAIGGRVVSSIDIAITLVTNGAPVDTKIMTALHNREARAKTHNLIEKLALLRSTIDSRPGAGEAE